MSKRTVLKLIMVAALWVAGQVFAATPALAGSPGDATTSTTAQGDISALRPITVKFEGVIEQCALPLPASWIIADLDVVVSETTVIVPPGIVPAPEDYAIVTALREDAVLTATRIVLCPEDDPTARAIEFRGIIGAFPQGPYYRGDWAVGNVSVELTSRAKLVGLPVLGHYAHVVGWLKHNQQVEAVSISVLNPADELARFEFQGTIQSPFDARGRLLTISGITGWVTEQTQIEGTLQIGAVADARGRRLPGGQLAFEYLRVLPEAEREVRLRGPIQAIDGPVRVWDVAGIRVLIDDLTYVDEVHGHASPGMWADVLAVQRGDCLYALRIRVERPSY